jgi:hypothetical protein
VNEDFRGGETTIEETYESEGQMQRQSQEPLAVTMGGRYSRLNRRLHMKAKTTQKKRPSASDAGMERQYQQIVGAPDPQRIIPEYQSLVQPSPYGIVQTFTTYGAYEDPI